MENPKFAAEQEYISLITGLYKWPDASSLRRFLSFFEDFVHLVVNIINLYVSTHNFIMNQNIHIGIYMSSSIYLRVSFNYFYH